jgi:hypothetical protein
VCPRCENDIPSAILETPNLPFSIVGVANAGKTNYITVMLHELGRLSGLRLALSAQNTATSQHQRFNQQLIYEQHTIPEGTRAGANTPQLWCIKNLGKQRGRSVPTYTFTIFDGAGEDHENLDPGSVECRYISSSKAIFLMLDPLILESVRRGGVVDPEVRRNSLAGNDGGTKNAEDVVNNIVTYIKAARGVKINVKLKIPVAVILTKFDTILAHPAFAQNALIKKPSLNISGGKIDTAEMRQVDAEIRNWLQVVGEGSFVNALESNFSEFQFFGVSSYGNPPKDASTLNNIAPHRVLDPVLWLFNRFKFVD